VHQLEPDHEIGVSKVLAGERAAPVAGKVDAVRVRELDRFRERRQGVEAERPVRLHGDAGIAGSRAEGALRKRAPEAVARADEDDLERSPDSLRDGVARVDPVEVRQGVETLRPPVNPHTGRVRTFAAAAEDRSPRRVPRAGVLLALAGRGYRLARKPLLYPLSYGGASRPR